MKKIVVLTVVVMLLSLTGCNNSIEYDSPNVQKVSSEVSYIQSQLSNYAQLTQVLENYSITNYFFKTVSLSNGSGELLFFDNDKHETYRIICVGHKAIAVDDMLGDFHADVYIPADKEEVKDTEPDLYYDYDIQMQTLNLRRTKI